MTTDDIGPYSNYRLTVRLALLNKPGIFAKVAALLAEEGANLGAVDIVSANAERMIRDITFDVQNETHGERVLERLESLPEVNVVSASDRIFLLHLGGKIRVQSKVPVNTRNVLSMIYTPGVGRVCQAIAKDPRKAYAFTIKSNSVAVVTDGSAVLGLGNLGPEAALPVMEGKVMLFKELRRHRCLADLPGDPGRGRDHSHRPRHRPRFRRHQSGGHQRAALFRDRTGAQSVARHSRHARRPARHGRRVAGRADQRTQGGRQADG